MNHSQTTFKKGLIGVGSLLRGYPFMFDHRKKELIDFTFKNILPHALSFADLGGVWRVNGAYSFYILDNYAIESAYLVDTNFTGKALQKRNGYKNLVLIEDNFGNATVAKQIERVSAILKPDWDEILEMYSPITDCFLIYNQQFIRSPKTVRLPDLGSEEYFRHVRVDRNSPGYKNLFDRPNEIHPQHKRPWRDIHNVWQWGITDGDLTGKMKQLGFGVVYQNNHGQFSDFTSFENHAFVFLRH